MGSCGLLSCAKLRLRLWLGLGTLVGNLKSSTKGTLLQASTEGAFIKHKVVHARLIALLFEFCSIMMIKRMRYYTASTAKI